jgi:hypothetical protein
MEETGKR